MHLNHKPGEVMQVDWAAILPLLIKQTPVKVSSACVRGNPALQWLQLRRSLFHELDSRTLPMWNACKYFGGVTRIIQRDNLKTGVQKHGKDEVVLNKSYQELAESIMACTNSAWSPRSQG